MNQKWLLRTVLLALVCLVGVAGAWLTAGLPFSQPTGAQVVPTMAVDANPCSEVDGTICDPSSQSGTPDNTFAINTRNDNSLTVTDVDPCVGVINPTATAQIQVDVVLNNAPNLMFSDIRFNLKNQAGNLLPQTTAAVTGITGTPFLDGSTPVGLYDLPVLRNGTLTTAPGNTRRTPSDAPALNDAGGIATDGANYIASTYQGNPAFFFSPDAPHPGQTRTNTTLSVAAAAVDSSITVTSAAGFAVNDIIAIGNTAAAAVEKKITAISGSTFTLSSAVGVAFPATTTTVQKGEPYQVLGAGALLARVTISIEPPAANSVIVLDLSTSAIATGVSGPGTDVGLAVTQANGEISATPATTVLTEGQMTDARIEVNATGTCGVVEPTATATATTAAATATRTPTATATTVAPTATRTATPAATATRTVTPTRTATPTVGPQTPTPTATPGGETCFGQPATIVGTSGDDDLEGTSGPDVIVGRGGNDEIQGKSGDDLICGGAGDDEIEGGSGDDSIDGDGGRDEIEGGSGKDTLTGGGGDDEIEGDSGDDIIDGEGDNDVIDGDSGDDVIRGSGGNDDAQGGSGNDEIEGNNGDDDLDGDSGDDIIRGGDGNDDLDGGPGDDTLRGGADNDDLHGGPGRDHCDGGAGGADTAEACETKDDIP